MNGSQLEVQRPVHILLVEDDVNDQALFCAAARRTGLELQVHTVPHGQEALEYLEGAGAYADRTACPLPEVLVLDLRMPVMDGFEVLSWCQASPVFRSLPVVALSGSVDEKWSKQALAAGASRFFLKSFRLEDWTTMVRDLWELAQEAGARTKAPLEGELAGSAH